MAKEKIERNLGFNTRALHTGYDPDPTTGARAVPIYQSTSFVFEDSDHAAALFGLQQFGNIYTRIMNPTTDVLEKRVASLESGVAGAGNVERSVCAGACHQQSDGEPATKWSPPARSTAGRTRSSMSVSAVSASKCNFVEPDDPENFRKAITPKTKLIFGETIGNPRVNVLDIEAVAGIAHEHEYPADRSTTHSPRRICAGRSTWRGHRRALV